LSQISWEATFLLENEPCVYVDRIATRPEYRGRGVGRALYSELFSHYRCHTILAGIAESPFRNDASIRFHEHLGFRRVGTYRAAQFAGIRNYVGGIFQRAAQQFAGADA